mgnify:CR=1 FL=1
MEYLVVILLIIILFLLLKKNTINEKFGRQLLSPDILEVTKNGSTANIIFKRDKNSSQEKTNAKSEYLIFYIDANQPNQGVWVQRKVLCSSDKCDFKLDNLTGIKYHLVMVETHEEKTSTIKKIVKFSDTNPYKLIEFTEQAKVVAQPVSQENQLEIVDPSKENQLEIVDPSTNPIVEMNVTKEKAPPPAPYTVCGNNPKVNYVKNSGDMEDMDYRIKCDEDMEITRLEEKVGRGLWGEFKKGYLSLDLKMDN